jgi:hypothetical protein
MDQHEPHDAAPSTLNSHDGGEYYGDYGDYGDYDDDYYSYGYGEYYNLDYYPSRVRTN